MSAPVKYPYKPYSPLWERAASNEARNFAPTIKPCADCGAPTVDGYCCTFCGSSEP